MMAQKKKKIEFQMFWGKKQKKSTFYLVLTKHPKLITASKSRR